MVNNVNDDGHQPAHHEDDRQAQTTPHQRLGPADAVPTTVSLTQRAPTAPIPTRTWIMKLTFQDYLALHFKHVCEQKNDCIRSQRADVEYGLSQGPNTGATEGITAESATFPYPPFYRSLMIHGEQQLRDAKELKTILGWDFGLDFIAGEISRKWEITPRDVYYKPLYLVVGLFPRGHPNPRERVVFVQHPKHLFWNLFWASFRLRGVSGTFLSLRHINGFRLYKVCVCILLATKTPTSIAHPFVYSAMPIRVFTSASTLTGTVVQTCYCWQTHTSGGSFLATL